MIPAHIIITARERPGSWLEQLARQNPDHRIRFFDDEAARDFVSEHFPGDTLTAYDKVRPGAYRADLFRYCALQVLGGIYSDCLIPYSLPFSEMWNLDLDRVYLVLDKNPKAIQVAIMACGPDSRFMQLCRQRATRNILSNFYGESPLSITGPKMAWHCFREYTGESAAAIGASYDAKGEGEPAVDFSYRIEKSTGGRWGKETAAVVVDSKQKALFPYKLNRDRKHRESGAYYWRAWNQGTVYGEKFPRLRRLLGRKGATSR